MSSLATRWAMRQRGLKPATKIVLWYLADCHNGETGECFPMQATIASECEMSRSTVNQHLDVLEKRGLIRRENSVDDKTKRQRPTRYELMFDSAPPVSGNKTRNATENRPQPVSGFHAQPVSENQPRAVSGFQQKPCPDFDESRVRIPDCNLGREPGREPLRKRARENPTPLSEKNERRAPPPEMPFETPNRDEDLSRFQEFWAAYPLKENRYDAEGAWVVATLHATPDRIIDAAKAYAAAKASTERRYLTQPAKWLTKKRWTDELQTDTALKSEKAERWARIARRTA